MPNDSDGRRLEYVPVTELVPAKRNPKGHAKEDLEASVVRFGFTEPLLLDERTGRLVAGHGRMDALKRMHADGALPPDGVRVDDSGAWCVPVVRGWASKTDKEADAYLVASNQLTTAGGWTEGLAELLRDIAPDGGLLGTGFGEADIERLLKEVKDASAPAEEPKERADTPEGIDDVPEPPAAPYVKPGESYQLGRHVIHCGDSRDVIPKLGAGMMHACVTDPPYEIGFMGRGWDNSGVAYDGKLWTAVLNALPPGGHILSFGATRTFHRMAVAIEDAGAELRDAIMWIYGTGFPKSHDVSKAIDEAAGAEREVVGPNPSYRKDQSNAPSFTLQRNPVLTAPATEAAKQWAGWGSALKPAVEPCVVARKPIVGTLAANVLNHGTGALNVDGCRVGADVIPATTRGVSRIGTFEGADGNVMPEHTGRWPANVILDEEAAAALDEQSGTLKSGAGQKNTRRAGGDIFKAGAGDARNFDASQGGASRFFYIAKASRTERDNGDEARHPTVKPVNLMRWLVRLVTPPGGRVLEPFSGSGTTLLACELEGLSCTAIEREAPYVQLAIARWEALTGQKAKRID